MSAADRAPSARLVEIFSSVQGEGPHVGATTLFVRFGGCDLRCRWCDSPHTWQPGPVCRLERARGSGRFETRPNPVPVAEALAACERLELAAHRFVSFTGGEPLLQPEPLRALAAAVRERGPRVHLETHGLCHEALAAVLDHVDHVAMDWKLASDVRRAADRGRGPRPAFHAEHARFLALAREAPEVAVKLVITPATGDAEVDTAARHIADTAPEAVVVVQPVTPFGPVREAPAAERLLSLVARLSAVLRDVRLIPQTHKLYGAP